MKTDTPIVLRLSPQEFFEITNIERFEDGSGYAAVLSVGSVGSGGLFTCIGHTFVFYDLDGFTQSLDAAYKAVGGKARLADTYERDFIEFNVSKTGQVGIGGLIVECDQELHFSFGCDQTFLPDLLRSLKQIVTELCHDHLNTATVNPSKKR